MEKSENAQTPASVAILIPTNGSGFFTAISIKNYLLSRGVSDFTVIEVRPYQLTRTHIPDEIKAIYVGGLGHKNCSRGSISTFINNFTHKIAFWAEVHPQGEEIRALNIAGRNTIYFDASDSDFASCTALLNKIWGDRIVKPDWVQSANFLENPTKYPSHMTAEIYKQIMYVAKLRDDHEAIAIHVESAKRLFAGNLLFGNNHSEIQNILKRYSKIKNASRATAKNIIPLHSEMPGVYIANCADKATIDKDMVMSETAQLTALHILAVQHYTPQGNPLTTLLTRTLDLPKLFAHLHPKTRESNWIFIHGDHEETKQKIMEHLERTGFKN